MDLNEELIINGHKLCLLFGDYKLIIDELIKKIINKYDNITIGFKFGGEYNFPPALEHLALPLPIYRRGKILDLPRTLKTINFF